MYKTREEAERTITELDQMRAQYGKPPVKRRIVERGDQFELIVIKTCQRCGDEVESQGATSLILCSKCWNRKRKEDARAAERAGEEARNAMAAHRDFEEMCQ